MAHSPDYFAYAYALVVLFGGIMGYARKGNLPSLIMGMASGLLLFYAAYQVSLSPQNAVLGLLISGSLAVMMGYRFFQSGAFMPAGLVAGLSVAMGGRYLLKLLS